MSSGFSGDYFSGRSQPFTSQLPELQSDPTAQILHRLPVIPGKRSLAEFQAQNQQNQALSFYLRNVKARNSSPSILGYPVSRQSNSGITPGFLNYPNLVPNQNEKMVSNTAIDPGFFNLPNLVPNTNEKMMNAESQSSELIAGNTPGVLNCSNPVLNQNDKTMSYKLQELEKHLLDDNDDDDDTTSAVTNSEWSETFHHLINPPPFHQPQPRYLSLSPSSSASSCCSSSPPSPKQTIIEAATAISENKPDLAREILARLTQAACVTGTAEQRLILYFSDALMARVGTAERDLHTETHAISTQMLFEVSPCFKLGFMAANLAILDATSSFEDAMSSKLHVVDFELGRGGHYVHLIHALASKNTQIPLKITAVTELGEPTVDKLRRVGEGLKSLAMKVGVNLSFFVLSLRKIADFSVETLVIESGENLAVNLSFALFKLPDESVTTDNPRDELLRRIKSLSPKVVTVVEQEMNMNTAPFLARVNEACGYYGALFESFDSVIARDNQDRVRIEEGLGRKLTNSIACEGSERVERCEVFGKWRARMGMAGLKPRPMTRPVVESVMARIKAGTRGNHGFTVKEENGTILFGWMGQTLTVASAWH